MEHMVIVVLLTIAFIGAAIVIIRDTIKKKSKKEQS